MGAAPVLAGGPTLNGYNYYNACCWCVMTRMYGVCQALSRELLAGRPPVVSSKPAMIRHGCIIIVTIIMIVSNQGGTAYRAHQRSACRTLPDTKQQS